MNLDSQNSIHIESVSRPINIYSTKLKRICLLLCFMPLILLSLTIRRAMSQVKPLIINFQPQPEQLSFEEIQKMKEDYLEKDFSFGLQQYYESIQESIKLVKITKNEKEGYSILVSSLQKCEMKIFQKSVQSLIQKFQQQKTISQIIWVVKTHQNQGKFSKWLEDYLKKQKLEFSLNQQTVDSSYNFLINHVSPHSQFVLLITNQMIVQRIQIEEKSFSQKGSLVFMGTFNQFNEKANFSSLSKNQIRNSVYFFKSSLLKIITPLNFAYQNVYTFDEIVILPIIALTQICNRLQVKEIVKLNNSLLTQKMERNSTQFSFRPLTFSEDPFVCFVAFPTVPTENSPNQIIKYLSKFQQQQIKNKDISQRSSIYISIVYSKEEEMSEVLIKALNLVKKGINIRLRIRQEKAFGSLEEYEVAFGYCPLGSVLFSSRLNVEPFVYQIFKEITDKKLCHYNNFMLIPKFIEKQKNISLNKIQNLTMYSFIQIFNQYFFHAQIICSSLVRQFRIQLFRQDEIYFYETQASYSMRAIFKSLANYSMSENCLFKVLHERTVTEGENKGLALLAMRDYSRNLQQPLKYSELNNIGYKRNPKNLIPKIIHQVWLSNEKTPSPLKIALAYTIRQTNPQFQYRLWTWEDVTRKNFPITFDSILRLIFISKRNHRNLLAFVVDVMRIELIYRYGGFYIDYKFQGVRSLEPFLKYEQIFAISGYNTLTNSMMASTKGNRYFYKILKDFSRPGYITQDYLLFQDFSMTGGKKISTVYTQKQIITQALSFYQFCFDGLKPCIYSQRTQPLQKDQKKFEGYTQFEAIFKYIIYIPCKLNKHKYLQQYDIQGRTYSRQNQDKNYFR